jgi:hypothetical protein
VSDLIIVTFEPEPAKDTWDFTPIQYDPADLAGAPEIGEYDRAKLASIFQIPASYYRRENNLFGIMHRMDANERMLDALLARGGIPGKSDDNPLA